MTDVIDPVEALRKLIEAAECIRHWHDAMRDGSGMVVSGEHVRALWDETERARAALTAAEAAGMVWVPKETLEAAERTLAHFVTDKSGSLMGLRAALSARPSLTGPEQATREGDATP